MPVNSISPNQPVQTTTVQKQTNVTEARKQSEKQEANKVQARRDTAGQNAQKIQKAQEPVKQSVNTNGQKVGGRIDVSA